MSTRSTGMTLFLHDAPGTCTLHAARLLRVRATAPGSSAAGAQARRSAEAESQAAQQACLWRAQGTARAGLLPLQPQWKAGGWWGVQGRLHLLHREAAAVLAVAAAAAGLLLLLSLLLNQGYWLQEEVQ